MQIATAATAAADAVRAMIVDGRLADGARINEVHLSAELGVSRTPLREALSRLVSEGALNAVWCGWIQNTKLAPNACAERMRLPTFIGFEIPSTPIPK